MLADRVRMGKAKKSEVEVTIHISNFSYLVIFVGDGTLNQYGDEVDYLRAENLIYTAYGEETVTLIVEKGSYISVDYISISISGSDEFYYTSLDSTIKSLEYPIFGGNIHITETMEIYYESVID